MTSILKTFSSRSLRPSFKMSSLTLTHFPRLLGVCVCSEACQMLTTIHSLDHPGLGFSSVNNPVCLDMHVFQGHELYLVLSMWSHHISAWLHVCFSTPTFLRLVNLDGEKKSSRTLFPAWISCLTWKCQVSSHMSYDLALSGLYGQIIWASLISNKFNAPCLHVTLHARIMGPVVIVAVFGS